MAGRFEVSLPNSDSIVRRGLTAPGAAVHNFVHGWNRNTRDYVATIEELLCAGAKAPKVTGDLEASDSVRDLLRRYPEGL
jgi:hypothetical protein